MQRKVWSRYPTVYEINTWVWLADLSAKYGIFVELGSVPPGEWDAISEFGFDAVWLMGVWERSPAGIAIANGNPGLQEDFRRALTDYYPEDNVGSPYCVRAYKVDEMLGGPSGLAAARKELTKRGLRLILDYVPNHVAPDHEWVSQHPEYFIQGNEDDITNAPASYLRAAGRVIACGRDPYFQAWQDVLQLNAFHPGLRRAVRETVASIAAQCDGIRCDMAMLLENPIFERTWGGRAGQKPATEYWAELIPAIKSSYPNFLFMAEAYWDREWNLQQQGFDFCYDKRLYDRLEHSSPEEVRLHLCAELAYQEKLVRFIENHDEPRAASTFSAPKQKAAAVVMATLPGARLFHEGQFEGRRVRPPVFLGRRPAECLDRDLLIFYRKLVKSLDRPLFHDGHWNLCERTGWPDNSGYQNLVAWAWEKDDQRCLVIVNLSDSRVQARVRVPWNDIRGQTWVLSDTISGATYDREGDEIQNQGLFVELGPYNFHVLECTRIHQRLLASAA